MVAPHGIRRGLLDRIEREVEAHRSGRQGRIRFKANAIVDEQIIDGLYRASQSGVRVEVVVRGICALRPGVPGFSENIAVRSILGEFLEHSRVMHFSAIDEFWIGSADMMHRNLDRRVEVMAQVRERRWTDYLDGVRLGDAHDEVLGVGAPTAIGRPHRRTAVKSAITRCG